MTEEDAIKILQDVRDRTRNSRIIEAIYTLHPELRESEDERIREEIVDYFKKECECLLNDFRDKEDEKQLSFYKKALAWLEMQKEQKPEERFEEARRKYQVEWSEEDEDVFNDILLDMADRREMFKSKGETIFAENTQKKIDWLDSHHLQLKYSSCPQPKQEWNTHDKAVVTCIACCLDGQFVPEAARKQAHEWFNKHRRDFLNSPSWKPSEEQIYSLGTVVKGYDECTVGSIGYHLKEMYNQLKKLM